MAVLVLGGYGLIGSAIVERLLAGGHTVQGLGRDVTAAARRWPEVRWIQHDLADLQTPAAWTDILAEVSVVVNAAGALQQSARDDLEAVQHKAMRALFAAAAAAGGRRIVQISAVGADTDSAIPFLATKARADAALRASGLSHAILRPALVLSPTAYGGTALLRGLAGLPLATPLVLANSPVQTVWIGDVAEAAVAAAEGRLGDQAAIDLAERPVRTLRETVRLIRAWLGFAPVPAPGVPATVGRLVAAAADLAGLAGWRSPLRSTALAVMADGVSGDPQAGPDALGHELRTLPQSLLLMPVGPQERWFARIWPLKAMAILVLSAFWIVSGVIGYVSRDAAAAVLTDRGMRAGVALCAAAAGSAIDILLGIALLVRRLARPALLGMIATTIAYGAGAILFTADLWLDPLGPLVKTAPVLLTCLFVLAVLEER